MTTSLRTAFFAALLVVLGLAPTGIVPAAATAQDLVREGNRYVRTVTKTFEVGPGGTLDIQTSGGPIHVVGSDRQSIEIEETIGIRSRDRDDAASAIREAAVEYEVSGTTLVVRTPRDRFRRSVMWEFDVRVPRRFTVNAATSGGPVTVEQIEGAVDARTSGGPITASDITGPADVRTSGGPIDLTNVSGSATASTAGGPIRAERIGGRLEAKTAGGPIEVRDVGDDARVKTSGGGIQAENVRGDLEAVTSGGDIEVVDVGGSLRAVTSGGDVDLASIGGAVEARTSGGDIEGQDFGGRVTAETRAGDIELTGVAAGIDAQTAVGDIEVEMTGTGSEMSMFDTSHGDVELIMPSTVAADLDIEVTSDWGGRIDRDDIMSAFPVTLEAERNGNLLRATGSLNGGGPTIRIRTRGGSVELREGE